ncbi:MAG: hypothetical protein PHR06_01930 [Candidatus Cloacimonetes bacterium]|nr:hypothetical protein [Candidatus Cloacimonadota bacterium]
MKKITLCLIVFSFFISLVAEKININWEKTFIKSQVTNHCLLEDIDYDKLFNTLDDSCEVSSELAVRNFQKIFNSIKKTFLRNDESVFYRNRGFKKYPYEFRMSVLSGGDFFQNDSNYYFVLNGLEVSTNLNNKLFFWGEWWSGNFNKDLDYAESSDLLDSFYKREQGKIFTDNLRAFITYKSEYGDFSIGRDNFNIGNNIGGSVILNDDCNEYGYFSWKLDFSKFTLSFLHGTLIADSTFIESGNYSYDYKNYDEKYLVLHKIEYRPSKNVTLFFGEEIIYGSRSIDPNYILPHVFWRITEHNLRDRDNVLIFAGCNVRIFDKAMWYTNIILDELRKKEIFGNWWGNKYAAQTGVSIEPFALGKEKVRFTLEATAVRPWLYTHKALPNKFSHDGIGLGFPAGSNLIQIAGELNIPIAGCFNFDTILSYTKQGSEGNQFYLNYGVIADTNNTEVKWLQGDVAKITNLKTVFTTRFFSHHHFKHSVIYTKVNNSTDLSFNLSYLLRY